MSSDLVLALCITKWLLLLHSSVARAILSGPYPLHIKSLQPTYQTDILLSTSSNPKDMSPYDYCEDKLTLKGTLKSG
jgi:hypothetical protein